MEISISNMTFADLENLKNFLQSDFDEFWSYDILLSELSSSNSRYIVAKNKDNTIVGFAGIKIILDEAELMNIVTRKDMRHCGIASSMLNHLLAICKENNIKLLNLEVNKKYNFNKVDFRKKYYDNTYDALLMTYKL